MKRHWSPKHEGIYMKKSRFISALGFALVLGFVLAAMFASCGGGGDDWPGIGGGDGGSTAVPGPYNDLATRLKSVMDNAQDGGTYIIEISNDEATGVIELSGFSYPTLMLNGITIILRGMGGVRTISSNSSVGLYLINVDWGVTLVLDNIALLRRGSTNSLVRVGFSGTLVMNAGSRITGSTGYGVEVLRDGNFTMNGGEISDNRFGGVKIDAGTFIMNGGRISGNHSSGVEVRGGGAFTMNGGEISGNSANGYGGGVFGTLTMNGGEISGNFASRGGGVYGSDIRIINGTIYGSDAPANLRNTVDTYDEGGAALYVSGDAGAEYGTFNGTTWNRTGSLGTTDNTIRVVNGALR